MQPKLYIYIYTFKVHKADKRTSRDRIRANATVPEIPKFAEAIYFKPAKTVAIAKDDPKFRVGIWLGFIDHTNEHLIGTTKGVIKCRAIRRKDETEQFSMIDIESMKGTP